MSIDLATATFLTSRETLERFRVRTSASKPPTSSNERKAVGESTIIQRRVSKTEDASDGEGISFDVVAKDSVEEGFGICLESRRRSSNNYRND